MAHNRTLWLFVVGFKIIRNEPPYTRLLHPQTKRMDIGYFRSSVKTHKKKICSLCDLCAEFFVVYIFMKILIVFSPSKCLCVYLILIHIKSAIAKQGSNPIQYRQFKYYGHESHQRSWRST